MLKKFSVLGFILILIISIMGVGFVSWAVKPSISKSLLIIDKSFSATQLERYNSSVNIMWLLNHLKLNNPIDAMPYDYSTDSYNSIAEYENKSKTNPEVVFLAEFRPDNDSYNDDLKKIAEYKKNGSLIVGEFNFIYDKKSERNIALEEFFGLNYSGYYGIYIKDFQEQEKLPKWVLDSYESNYGRKWDLEGDGIAIGSSNGELFILRNDYHYQGHSYHSVVAENFQNLVPGEKYTYYGWFEIIDKWQGEPVAWLELDLTAEGQKIIADTGINFAKIPLAIKSDHTLYFAGDFSNNPMEERIYSFNKALRLYGWFALPKSGDLSNFYWNFYLPTWQKLILNN